MVIPLSNQSTRQRGSLMAEMLVAIAILLAVILPVAYSFDAEKRLARTYYSHAVAMEIVDGEMEVLLAGEWRAFTPGTHAYIPKADSLANLPPGKFAVTVQPGKVRLEWQPAAKQYGGLVVREATIQ